MQTAFNNQVVTLTKAVGARPTGAYTVAGVPAFFRAQRLRHDLVRYANGRTDRPRN